jgi:hypothetical protein
MYLYYNILPPSHGNWHFSTLILSHRKCPHRDRFHTSLHTIATEILPHTCLSLAVSPPTLGLGSSPLPDSVADPAALPSASRHWLPFPPPPPHPLRHYLRHPHCLSSPNLALSATAPPIEVTLDSMADGDEEKLQDNHSECDPHAVPCIFTHSPTGLSPFGLVGSSGAP